MSESDVAEIFRRLSGIELSVNGLQKDLNYVTGDLEKRVKKIEDDATASARDWRSVGMGLFQNALWAVAAGALGYFMHS